jgi:hypothetical protein
MKLINTASLALILALSGCATTDHIYNAEGQCLTCFNNPFTGEAMNHDGSNNKHMEVAKPLSEDIPPRTEEPTSTSHPYDMKQVTFNSGVNVDVAFIALKEEFQFRSAEEVKKEMGSFADYKLRSSDYEWKVLPSVSYTMGSERKILGSHMNVLVTVNKRTDTSSIVIAKYWPRNKSDDEKAVGNHILSRIQKALSN